MQTWLAFGENDHRPGERQRAAATRFVRRNLDRPAAAFNGWQLDRPAEAAFCDWQLERLAASAAFCSWQLDRPTAAQ